MTPTIQVVMRGLSLTSNEGNYGPCGVYLIRAEDSSGVPRTILYDFGHAGRRQKLRAALERVGVTPEEVDYAVLSHAHWDHVQNIDMFPRASAIVHQAEMEYLDHIHPDDHATPPWTKGVVDSLPVRAVVDGEEILPGITVLHLPGHTAGSMGLIVPTEDGQAIFSGDALAAAVDAVAERCPNVFWDGVAADNSIRRVKELADIIYPGHDRPFALTGAGDVEYREPLRPLKLLVREIDSPPITIGEQNRSQRGYLGHAAELNTQRAAKLNTKES